MRVNQTEKGASDEHIPFYMAYLSPRKFWIGREQQSGMLLSFILLW